MRALSSFLVVACLPCVITLKVRPPPNRPPSLPRRQVLQTAAAAAVAGIATGAPAWAEPPTELVWPTELAPELVWQPKSANAPRAAKTSYQPTFVTYLARFLLNYDRSSAGWWRAQASGLPVSLDRKGLKAIRYKQFGQFSESVEVGLQNYQGRQGVRNLFSLLRSRYGTSPQGKVQLALVRI